MFKSLMLGLTTAALGVAALAPTAASAQRYGAPYGYGYDRGYDRGYEQGYDRDYRGGYDGRDDGYRYERAYRDAGREGWNQGPAYYADRGYARPRRCSSGTTGTVIGAIAGGLLGRTIDTRGDRSLGTILGAGGGALAGRAVERSNNPGYCR